MKILMLSAAAILLAGGYGTLAADDVVADDTIVYQEYEPAHEPVHSASPCAAGTVVSQARTCQAADSPPVVSPCPAGTVVGGCVAVIEPRPIASIPCVGPGSSVYQRRTTGVVRYRCGVVSPSPCH